MKKESLSLFTEMSNTAVETLTQEVKEIVTGLINRPKVISAADVWNIQRQKRGLVKRRFAL